MSIVLDGTTGLAGAATGALNGTLGATTPSTVAATTVVASSTIKGATTIAVGNATPSASGAGITFPATQSASTDANTLDDYEEGTWTPTFTNWTGTFTNTGVYRKVGSLVFFTLEIIATTTTASTANSSYFTLPFTPNVRAVVNGSTYNITSNGQGLAYESGIVYSPTISLTSTAKGYITGVYSV